MSRAIVFVLACSLSAQTPTFRGGISVVEVDAQVVEPGGVVEGLQARDFVVRDGRQPVALRYCVEEETPLDVVLLYELSRFMAGKVTELRAASEVALAELRPRDRVAVMWFNDQVQLAQAWTTDLKDLKARLRLGLAESSAGGLPYVLTAVSQSAKYLAARTEPRGRGVVLMFTGDAGYGTAHQNHSGVARDLWEADASLAAMIIPNVLTRITNDQNPFHTFKLLELGFNLGDYIDDVAAQTGGPIVITAKAGDLHQTPRPRLALQQAIERMRRRYRLYYDMPAAKPGETRRIAVNLSPAMRAAHPEARIMARKGYVAR